MKILVILLIILSFGCAAYQNRNLAWTKDVSYSEEEYQKDCADCKHEAMLYRGTSDNPSIFGQVLEEQIRENKLFLNCMNHRGWFTINKNTLEKKTPEFL